MDKFKDHFSLHALNYAAYRPSYPLQLIKWLSSLVPETHHALDCGCGNGQMAVMLANFFNLVTAVDASKEQIAHAYPHKNVSYHVATAETVKLQDASVDLIVAAQAAHWFDLPRFFDSVKRIGNDQSVLAFISYSTLKIDDAINPVINHFYKNVLGPYWPPERCHVDDNYRNLSFPFQEIDVSPFTMEIEWDCAAFLAYIRTWSALQRMEKILGLEPFNSFKDNIERVWGETSNIRKICFPLSVRAGRIKI
jgi:SAM-dependent methyltransferase